MASGSQAAAKHRLQVAGYWTGASSANRQPRCDNCVHVRPPFSWWGITRYDRRCELHGAPVKTHGCCRQHARATPSPT